MLVCFGIDQKLAVCITHALAKKESDSVFDSSPTAFQRKKKYCETTSELLQETKKP